MRRTILGMAALVAFGASIGTDASAAAPEPPGEQGAECPAASGTTLEIAARIAALADTKRRVECVTDHLAARPEHGAELVRALLEHHGEAVSAMWGIPPGSGARKQLTAYVLWMVAAAMEQGGPRDEADQLRLQAVWEDPDSSNLVGAYVETSKRERQGVERATRLCESLAKRQQWTRLTACLQAVGPAADLGALWIDSLSHRPRLEWTDLEEAGRAASSTRPLLEELERCRGGDARQVGLMEQRALPAEPPGRVSSLYEAFSASLFGGDDDRAGICVLSLAASKCIDEQRRHPKGCLAPRALGRYVVELYRRGGQGAVADFEGRLEEGTDLHVRFQRNEQGKRALYHFHLAMAAIYERDTTEQKSAALVAQQDSKRRFNFHRGKANQFWVDKKQTLPNGLLPPEKTKDLIVLQGFGLRLAGGAGYQFDGATGGMFELGFTAARADSSFLTANSGSVTVVYGSHAAAPWRIGWHLYQFEQLFLPPTQNVLGFGVTLLRGQHDLATDRHNYRWLEATFQVNAAGSMSDEELEFYSDGQFPFFVGVSLDHLFGDREIFGVWLVAGMAPMWRSSDVDLELAAEVVGRFDVGDLDGNAAIESELSVSYVGAHQLFHDDGSVFRVGLVARHSYWLRPERSLGLHASTEHPHSFTVMLSLETSFLQVGL